PVCLANAVADALGRADITMPLKPARILEWIAAEEPPSRQPAIPLRTKSAGITGAGSVEVHGTPQAVWSALLDEAKLRQAIPGCERLERVGTNLFKASVMLGAGPVRGCFEADVGLFELEEPRSAVLRGTLSGLLGAAAGAGWLTLTPTAG